MVWLLNGLGFSWNWVEMNQVKLGLWLRSSSVQDGLGIEVGPGLGFAIG